MTFGKKKEEKKTLEERFGELLDELEGLPEEEQKKFWDKFEKKSPDEQEPTTDEQIEKAEEDIEEKGPDSQTEKDRIDESVGEQEKEDDDEDSQSAKDRVDESEGEEKHLEDDRLGKLEEKFDGLMLKLSQQFGWGDEDSETAEQAKKVYGLGEGIVANKETEDDKKKPDKEAVKATLNKFM